jgi:anaerobic dimethyl sulfoxide reductase subunit A
MVTPHSLYRINSSYSNIKWFREKEPQRLRLHPADAEKRMIKDRQKVIISSSIGEMIIPVQITEDIMPGVVCLHQGVWPDLDKNGCDSAGSANILTSTEPTKPSDGSRTHSIFVEVEPYKPE